MITWKGCLFLLIYWTGPFLVLALAAWLGDLVGKWIMYVIAVPVVIFLLGSVLAGYFRRDPSPYRSGPAEMGAISEFQHDDG